ncbi:MAG: flagellar biosynthetic protein FliR [Negativicutes bacterium]|nr:flagellar biosynthetic protein FliR [Negativicutes bacterium]
MDIYSLLQNQLGFFLLVFCRISGIFTTAPIFGSRNVPTYAKSGLALALACLLAPIVHTPNTSPDALPAYILIVMGELAIGIMIGYVASLVFSAVQIAGQLLDMQIGFGIINIFDPQSGQQMPLIGNFKYILALLVFLSTNGHHFLLTALTSSFKLIPVGSSIWNTAITAIFVDIVKGIFIIAFKISLPVLVAVFLTDIALGILARTMPQMNIFVVGVPGKIIVGVFVLSLALPFYILFLEVAFNGMHQDVYRLLATIVR